MDWCSDSHLACSCCCSSAQEDNNQLGDFSVRCGSCTVIGPVGTSRNWSQEKHSGSILNLLLAGRFGDGHEVLSARKPVVRQNVNKVPRMNLMRRGQFLQAAKLRKRVEEICGEDLRSSNIATLFFQFSPTKSTSDLFSKFVKILFQQHAHTTHTAVKLATHTHTRAHTHSLTTPRNRTCTASSGLHQ